MADVLLETSDADGGVVKHVVGPHGVPGLSAADAEREENRKKEWETVVAGVAGLYCMTLIGLGSVFPIAFFLSGERFHNGIYLSIFHIYVYSLALVFIVYLYISIQCYKNAMRPSRNNKLTTTYKRMSELEEGAAIAPLPDNNSNRKSESDAEVGSGTIPGPSGRQYLPPPPPPPEVELLPAEEIGVEADSGNGGITAVLQQQAEDTIERRHLAGCGAGGQMPMVDHSGHGANFFLRMGLIAFGLGSAMLDAFRLLQFLETDIFQCYGLLFVINSALRLTFILAQSFFLFKHHKVILNYHKSVMKFGLLHLVATNIVTWMLTIVLEANDAFAHHNSHDAEGNPAYNHTGSESNLKLSVKHHESKVRPANSCVRKPTLAVEASPYLFPFVIEFSLLAAAILYRLYTNIGKCAIVWTDSDLNGSANNTLTSMSGKATGGATTTTVGATNTGTSESHGVRKNNTQCHKANSGLFPGLVVFTMVFVGMCFTLYYQSSPSAIPTAGGISLELGIVPGRGLIHQLSDLSVNAITLVAIFPAFCYLRKLRFTAHGSNLGLDQVLLVIALAGYYLLLGFMGVAAFSQLTDEHTRHFAPVVGASCVLTFAQATLQVCFIFDGLRRTVRSAKQAEQKPARSFITFLLICNLAMWVINSFELKEAHRARLYTEFYGGLGWTIIMHVCLPLAVYFRFHAAVCLSDIWLNAYKLQRVCLLSPTAAARSKKK